VKLTELEAAARAATPSPWTAKRYGVIVGGVTRQYVNGSAQDQLVMVSALNHDNAGSQDANTAFITAMQPDFALKLIAVAQAAKAHNDNCLACCEQKKIGNWGASEKDLCEAYTSRGRDMCVGCPRDDMVAVEELAALERT